MMEDTTYSPATRHAATNSCVVSFVYSAIAMSPEMTIARLYGRAKIGGHPGAPPPNRLRRRKHNKHRNQHAHNGSTPQTVTACEKNSPEVRGRVRRKRREPNFAGASGRHTSQAGQGGSASDDSRHATTRPSCPVHPSSAFSVQARFMSSDLNRAGVIVGNGRETDITDCAASQAEGEVAYQKIASRRRVEGGCIISKNTIGVYYQADLGEEPPVVRAAASDNKRRTSLLRVRS